MTTGSPLCTPEQLVELREHVRFAYASTSFYRSRFDAAGVTPEMLETYADLTRFPMVTKTEVIDAQTASPPFGGQRAESGASLRAFTATRVRFCCGSRKPISSKWARCSAA